MSLYVLHRSHALQLYCNAIHVAIVSTAEGMLGLDAALWQSAGVPLDSSTKSRTAAQLSLGKLVSHEGVSPRSTCALKSVVTSRQTNLSLTANHCQNPMLIFQSYLSLNLDVCTCAFLAQLVT